MRPDEMQFMIDLLYKRSGLALTEEKAYLLENRLSPIARVHGCADLSGLIQKLQSSPSPQLLTEVTDAMMTHESSFFRDGKPFEHLRKTLLPALRDKAAGKHLRIWSAACSTGQEPYSIAITLLEDAAQNPGWTYEIVATDLVAKTVERAKQANYSQFEAQRGMPIQMLLKYFKQNTDTSWQAKDELRSMVRFQTHNLLEDASPAGAFDLIFCRNVLIYFDAKAKRMAVDKLCQALKPKGVFIIGSTESLIGYSDGLTLLEGMPGIYRKNENVPAAKQVAG